MTGWMILFTAIILFIVFAYVCSCVNGYKYRRNHPHISYTHGLWLEHGDSDKDTGHVLLLVAIITLTIIWCLIMYNTTELFVRISNFMDAKYIQI